MWVRSARISDCVDGSGPYQTTNTKATIRRGRVWIRLLRNIATVTLLQPSLSWLPCLLLEVSVELSLELLVLQKPDWALLTWYTLLNLFDDVGNIIFWNSTLPQILAIAHIDIYHALFHFEMSGFYFLLAWVLEYLLVRSWIKFLYRTDSIEDLTDVISSAVSHLESDFLRSRCRLAGLLFLWAGAQRVASWFHQQFLFCLWVAPGLAHSIRYSLSL